MAENAGHDAARDFDTRQRRAERAFVALFDTFAEFDDLVRQCIPLLPRESSASNPPAGTEAPRERTPTARRTTSRSSKTTSARQRTYPSGLHAVRSARR